MPNTGNFHPYRRDRSRDRIDRPKDWQYSCGLCKEDHALKSCRKYRDFSPQTRYLAMERGGYCRNCLARSHQLQNCQALEGCRKCDRRHHTSLHGAPQLCRSLQSSTRDEPRVEISLDIERHLDSKRIVNNRTSKCFDSTSGVKRSLGADRVLVADRSFDAEKSLSPERSLRLEADILDAERYLRSDRTLLSDRSLGRDRSSEHERSLAADRPLCSDGSLGRNRSSDHERSSVADRTLRSNGSFGRNRSLEHERSLGADRSLYSDRALGTDKSIGAERSLVPVRALDDDRPSAVERSVVFVPTAMVRISESNSESWASVRAILNQSSTVSCIAAATFRRLNLTSFQYQGHQFTTFTIMARQLRNSWSLQMMARITDDLPRRPYSSPLSDDPTENFSTDTSADIDPRSNAPIELEFGADVYSRIHQDGVISTGLGQVHAYRTNFGYVFSGPSRDPFSNHVKFN